MTVVVEVVAAAPVGVAAVDDAEEEEEEEEEEEAEASGRPDEGGNHLVLMPLSPPASVTLPSAPLLVSPLLPAMALSACSEGGADNQVS